MPVLISGILRDGAGNPVQDCTIQLSARKTSATVVVEVTSSTVTDANGHYSIEAEPGYYSVSLLREGFPPSVAGDIYVAPTDAPDTLNAFLDAPKDADLRPEVMKRFEEMVNRTAALYQKVEKDRERAEQAAQSAEQSKDATALSETSARESALTATQAAEQGNNSAAAAALSEQHARESSDKAAKSETAASASAESASSSEESALQSAETAENQKNAATESANRAEQARDEALTSRNEAVEAAETAATDAAVKAAGKVSAQLKAAVADDTQRAEAAMTGAESAAVASQGYRDEARDIANSLKLVDATTTQKGLVQLSSDDDSDSEALAATPKAVKKVKDLTDQKAPLDSPELAGTPTTPTPPLSVSNKQIANTEYVQAAVAALVGSSPEALDTLAELADALNNDPNFATTMLNALAGKQPLHHILTAISGLNSAANKMPYFNSANSMALANLTAIGRDLMGHESVAKVLEYLGLTALGIAGQGVGLASLDWQTFNFIPGARYYVSAGTITNSPEGMELPDSSVIVNIEVSGYEGNHRHIEVWFSTVSIGYRRYQVRLTWNNVPGGRSMLVRRYWTDADVIPLSSGGLGSNTVAGALSNLGLVDALKNKQPLNDSLTSLSSLEGEHNKFPYFNAPGSFVLGDITDIGKGIISCLTVDAVYLYLGIKTAALKNVGTGPGQIPDMGSQSVTLTNGGGVQYFSNGVIRQWGLTSPIGGSGGSVDVTFPVPFPNQVQQVRLFDAGNPVASVNFCMAGVTTKDGMKVWGVASISATGPSISPLQAGKGSLWEAWGN